VHAKESYLPALETIVKGVAEDNVRARVGPICASPSEQVSSHWPCTKLFPGVANSILLTIQVDCLVDQATDPNILGRTYAGWAAWI